MANRTLKGPTPIKLFADQRYRLDWHRVPAEELPPSYQTHYVAYHEGTPRAEMFWGKVGEWWCVVYEGPTFACDDGADAALHLVAVICGGPAS